MQTIEYRNIDKTDWPAGPWHDEPDKKQWQDAVTGLPCLIKRNPIGGNLCGYVGVPRWHPLYGVNYDDEKADHLAVHGGLTYSSECSEGPEDQAICHKVEPGESDDVWWFGFDCGHYNDYFPSPNLRMPGRGTAAYRDLAYVTVEIEGLAAQIGSGWRTTMTVTLTDNEVRVLKLILSVDLDALGLEQKDQGPARTVLKKLRDAALLR